MCHTPIQFTIKDNHRTERPKIINKKRGNLPVAHLYLFFYSRRSSAAAFVGGSTLMPNLTLRKMHKAEQFLEMLVRESPSRVLLQRTPHNSNRSRLRNVRVKATRPYGLAKAFKRHPQQMGLTYIELLHLSALNQITKILGRKWELAGRVTRTTYTFTIDHLTQPFMWKIFRLKKMLLKNCSNNIFI